MYKFPSDFLWGTATSAHQIEGNNTNSDWWDWETGKPPERPYPEEPSGDACDSYNRYEEDFDLCTQLNNNAIRIGIEWARLEPEQGKFSEEAFEHYRKVLQAAKDRNLKTFVTLHHFTNPKWFRDLDGWQSPKSAKLFGIYAKKCAEELGDLADVFLTINEPQVYALMGHIRGFWPPGKRNPITSFIVQINFMRAHRNAYDQIKKVNKEFTVGVVKNIVWYETDPFNSNFLDRAFAHILNFIGRDFFLRPVKSKLDVLGLNYYFTNRIKNFQINNPGDYGSDLGWWINPGGLRHILVYLKNYNVPVYVTENGLADSQDRLRSHFIQDHLISCALAIEEGANLKGYFHWSLLDNYEWHHGFWPRFGLVEIDHNDNLKRKPRPSFYYYSEICKNNAVDL